ncbi:MAG: hypothetical protein QXJ14_02825 [Candidatus Aenigmatarchaeota archaeon]
MEQKEIENITMKELKNILQKNEKDKIDEIIRYIAGPKYYEIRALLELLGIKIGGKSHGASHKSNFG